MKYCKYWRCGGASETEGPDIRGSYGKTAGQLVDIFWLMNREAPASETELHSWRHPSFSHWFPPGLCCVPLVIYSTDKRADARGSRNLESADDSAVAALLSSRCSL